MSDESFERDEQVNEPGIVGARWWNRSLKDEASAVSRREALGKLMAGLAVAGTVAACGVGIVLAEEDGTERHTQDALNAQRTFGWNLGARDRSLVYSTGAVGLATPAQLSLARTAMEPSAWRHVHVRTLFEAVDAYPMANLSEETLSFQPLGSVLLVADSVVLQPDVDRGALLARLLSGTAGRVAVLVDLPGERSVAVAAGASGLLEPVFLISNWPHPLGAVPVQRALSAVLALASRFEEGRQQRAATPPPLFVLERNRLPYSVANTMFDNRFLTPVPSAATLRAGGVEKLLYVVSDPSSVQELDDLNEDLVALARAGIAVHAVALSEFSPGSDGALHYLGQAERDADFLADRGLLPADASAPSTYYGDAVTRLYEPRPRPTIFTRGRTPAGFGTVELVYSNSSPLGAAFDTRGSWNRSSSFWSGG